ncbi:MAG: choice-of-anchor Q domain-containing protein [Polyangia bacterium]
MSLVLHRLAPLVLALAIAPASASAATFAVTTTSDAGAGSLRDAISQANATGGSNTINITATGTIGLASALPDLSTDLAIVGPGAANLLIRPNQGVSSKIFYVEMAATVSISGVTLSYGSVVTGARQGGAIYSASTLQLSDCVLSHNVGPAAAILSEGPLTISRCTITQNNGDAVIEAGGATTTITDSSISGNTGGALHEYFSDTLTIDRCTIANNTTGIAGGIRVENQAVDVSNSTFSGNSGVYAGDFWVYSTGVTMTLTNVTAANSSSPSLLDDFVGQTPTVNVRNTIFAGTGARCKLTSGLMISKGHNLASDGTCALTDATDLPNTDPVLAPLGNYGGPTDTYAIFPGSPALDAGDDTNVEATDQRGKPRLYGAHVDIGAFEYDAMTLPLDMRMQPVADLALPPHDEGTAMGADDLAAGTPDVDAGAPPSTPPSSSRGCACNVASAATPTSGALLLLVLLALTARRLRRR